ncbi:hypothetical protein KI387_037462, partial [Taxus chinensis]
ALEAGRRWGRALCAGAQRGQRRCARGQGSGGGQGGQGRVVGKGGFHRGSGEGQGWGGRVRGVWDCRESGGCGGQGTGLRFGRDRVRGSVWG